MCFLKVRQVVNYLTQKAFLILKILSRFFPLINLIFVLREKQFLACGKKA